MLAENGCFERNIDYIGNDIKKVKFSDYDYSIIKVQKMCQETADCKGFTILTNNNVWVKRAVTKTPKENVISGPDICISKYFKFTLKIVSCN